MSVYSFSMRLISALACVALLTSSSAFTQTSRPVTPTSSASKTYELRGGWWFNGRRFARRQFYVVAGVFTTARPAHVDEMLDFGASYVVPPFGDAHMHGFDDPAAVAAAIDADLREGVFYAMSLTNSIRGRRAVADRVNHPGSVDVAYADAGLTSTRGHPIMSAEMTANHWSWDSLGTHWQDLLRSRKAEGDVYFIIDNLADVRQQWSRIIASRPDIIKIYLLDTERDKVLRADSNALGTTGLPPKVVPAIVAKAHASGLRVAAHIETAADFHLAVTSGVDVVAHLPGIAIRAHADIPRFVISDADAALAARRGVVVIPTAWLAGQERIARGDSAQVERTRRIQKINLERLSRKAVRLAVGADLFVNASVEAAYLRDLHVFDNSALLRMWSETTPRIIFPGRRIGRLSTRHEASLLLLSCDPIKNFECTKQITLRMKQGRILAAPTGQGH
jgi:hypothetical protein